MQNPDMIRINIAWPVSKMKRKRIIRNGKRERERESKKKDENKCRKFLKMLSGLLEGERGLQICVLKSPP